MSAADLEKLVLQRARNGLRPSTAQRKALVSRLTVTLSAAPLSAPSAVTTEPKTAAGTGFDPTQLGVGAAALRFSKSMMLTGILSGALLGFGAGYWVSPGRAPDMQRRVQPGNDKVEQSAPQVALLPPPTSVTPPKSEALPTAEIPSPTPAGSAKARRLQQEPSAATSDSAPTFYEELSYVRRAQSALQRGDGTLALGLMQSLDEIQPGGALLAERNVTRILALCQLDRSEEAIALTRSMLTSDSTSQIYRHRLSVSCARDALSEGGE